MLWALETTAWSPMQKPNGIISTSTRLFSTYPGENTSAFVTRDIWKAATPILAWCGTLLGRLEFGHVWKRGGWPDYCCIRNKLNASKSVNWWRAPSSQHVLRKWTQSSSENWFRSVAKNKCAQMSQSGTSRGWVSAERISPALRSTTRSKACQLCRGAG